jgi:hypothetical protein
MRKMTAAILVTATAACAPMNIVRTGASPQPIQPTLDCLKRAVDSLSYSRSPFGFPEYHNYTNPPAPGFRASKADTVPGSDDFTLDVITVRLAKERGDSTSFKVAGHTYLRHDQRSSLDTQEWDQNIEVSKRVVSDVVAVTARCGSS